MPNPRRFGLKEELREEAKELNTYARDIFSIFARWWAFFIAANLTAGAFLGGEDRPESYLLIGRLIFFFDLFGAGFCLIASVRLVQINDRIVEIASRRRPEDSPLGNPSMSSFWTCFKMVYQLFAQWLWQPKRTRHEYNSPLPISFYLWCTLPTMFCCLLVAFLWCHSANQPGKPPIDMRDNGQTIKR
ncbi:hypothetical protein DTL42_25655 [Bremerella cremea]|uniref:Uncharacterized protein n=1 Tax=Bremerella cremea TaxID=1031537 RepID=A0A368KJK6_9BACT|nr:hypothetical protein [Bremerella cremea]RCS40751.1 hypothetical protein DTL42_25655 [Bremerella cremea]